MKKYGLICLLFFIIVNTIFAKPEIMLIKDIKPGMIGYGLSVFKGNKIERFNVEVITILEKFLPDQDIILIRCRPAFGQFDINSSGIIAGMSGSPIFIEGKLIGALAYGWINTKDSLAGVTPIKNMIEITKIPLTNKLGCRIENKEDDNIIKPLKTPLMITNSSLYILKKYRNYFSKYGLMPIQGGAQSNSNNNDILQPGSPIGAQLMNGDMDITAMGTVTWVDKDKVLGFGHPFLNSGEFNMPVTTGRIATVIRSSRMSSKLGIPGKVVGTLYQDRTTGIYAKLGSICQMIPIKIKLKNNTTKLGKTFNVKVIRHPVFTKLLANFAVNNFIETQEPMLNENTVIYNTRVFLKNIKKPIEWSDMESNSLSIKGNFLAPILYLYNNPFKIPDIEKIIIDITIVPKLNIAKIVSLKLSRQKLKVGKNIEIEVGLKVQYGKKESIQIKLPVPKNISPGNYNIKVSGGKLYRPDLFESKNYQDYISNIKKLNNYRNNHIVALFELPELEVLYKGKKLSNLPKSVIGNLLPTNQNSNIQLKQKLCITAHQTPYEITGISNIFVNIQDEN